MIGYLRHIYVDTHLVLDKGYAKHARMSLFALPFLPICRLMLYLGCVVPCGDEGGGD